MLDLTTPSLLFSAISLILLAYTNRFLAYANVVRSLKDKYQQSGNPQDIEQIKNLRKRLKEAGATAELKAVYGVGYKLITE